MGRLPADIPEVDFGASAQTVFAQLYERVPLALWMITRVVGDDQIVLQALDHSYGLQPGAVLRWADSVCARMAAGVGPRMAPDVACIPAYADAPLAKTLPVGAYVGVPLLKEDGAILGTFAGLNPRPQPDSIVGQAQLVNVFADLLGNLLAAELRLQGEARRSERAQLAGLEDAQAGTANRRAWDLLMNMEEFRSQRYGSAASVVIVGLDGRAPDSPAAAFSEHDLLQWVGSTIASMIRGDDFVAHMGKGEFGVFVADTGAEDAARVLLRMLGMLQGSGVQASGGVASRSASSGLRQAWHEADAMMYKSRRRKQQYADEHTSPADAIAPVTPIAPVT